MVKSYFCPRCGKGYNQKECINNSGKLFCYDCPSIQLQISGTPLMLIGVFLGLMYLAYYFYGNYDQVSYYATFIFLPACAGLIFLGLVRNNNQHKAAQTCCKNDLPEEEKQGPIKDEVKAETKEENPVDTTEDAPSEAPAEAQECEA